MQTALSSSATRWPFLSFRHSPATQLRQAPWLSLPELVCLRMVWRGDFALPCIPICFSHMFIILLNSTSNLPLLFSSVSHDRRGGSSEAVSGLVEHICEPHPQILSYWSFPATAGALEAFSSYQYTICCRIRCRDSTEACDVGKVASLGICCSGPRY